MEGEEVPLREEDPAEDAAAAAAARKKQLLDTAREVVERELGDALRRTDLDDELAGMTFDEEDFSANNRMKRPLQPIGKIKSSPILSTTGATGSICLHHEDVHHSMLQCSCSFHFPISAHKALKISLPMTTVRLNLLDQGLVLDICAVKDNENTFGFRVFVCHWGVVRCLLIKELILQQFVS
eukprot:432842-Amphidinium_carterae.1